MLFFLLYIEDSHDKCKLEELYLKYNKDMFRVAFRILNDYHLAQDAVQLAFIKLIDNLNKINEINCNRTRSFVVIIVRNVSINLYRKRKKESNISLDGMEYDIPDSNEMMIEDRVINDEMLEKISSKIKELHPPYADIISLKYFFHYSNDEIAKILGISNENVRVRLHCARQSLIKLLNEEGSNRL